MRAKRRIAHGALRGDARGQTLGLAPFVARYAALLPDGHSGAAPTAVGPGAAPVRLARSG